MYKTSVITDEISQDLVVAAELARKFGLDGLEIRSVNEKNPFQMNVQDFAHVREVADAFGLAVCVISAPLFKCAMDDEQTIREHCDGLRRCMEAAHLWGCGIIRGFTFWNDGLGRESFARIAESYQEPIRIARENAVVIAIESEPSVCTHNSWLLADFLEQVDVPELAAIWDPGNEISDHTAPSPYPDGYNRLHRHIRHVHLKDIRRTPVGYDPVLIGDGDVDFHSALKRLVTDGYAGCVSVETHFRFRSRLAETTIVQPQGSGFSAGGYEATVAYLEALRDKYDWMGCVK